MKFLIDIVNVAYEIPACAGMKLKITKTIVKYHKMDNNDKLRRLRYALSISNSEMAGIFKLADYDISGSEILAILKREDEEGYTECSDRIFGLFLDGLIIKNRGRKESAETVAPVKTETRLSNNLVLKKLRIALDLKENDMLEIFRISGFEITKPELSALFRKKGHKNYKVCGDQIIKNFLKGLTVQFRGEKENQ